MSRWQRRRHEEESAAPPTRQLHHVVQHGSVDKGNSLSRGGSTSGAGVNLVATGSSFAITARGRCDRDEWAPSPRQPQHAKAALIFTTRLNSGRGNVVEYTLKRSFISSALLFALSALYIRLGLPCVLRDGVDNSTRDC